METRRLRIGTPWNNWPAEGDNNWLQKRNEVVIIKWRNLPFYISQSHKLSVSAAYQTMTAAAISAASPLLFESPLPNSGSTWSCLVWRQCVQWIISFHFISIPHVHCLYLCTTRQMTRMGKSTNSWTPRSRWRNGCWARSGGERKTVCRS